MADKIYRIEAGGKTIFTTNEKLVKSEQVIQNGLFGHDVEYEELEFTPETVCQLLNDVYEKIDEFENSFSNLRNWLEQGGGLC